MKQYSNEEKYELMMQYPILQKFMMDKGYSIHDLIKEKGNTMKDLIGYRNKGELGLV